LGKVGKKKVKEITAVVKPELVYPLIRGRDHKKWHGEPSGYVLLPVDEKGKTMPTSKFRTDYPQEYKFFNEFFDELVKRGGQPYKSKLKPYREKSKTIAEKEAPPFYWLFNAKPSLAPYKVMWKYVAGKVSGKGEFSVALITPVEDKWLGKKTPIPNEKLMLIPFVNEDEAHFVSAVLNSSAVRAIVAGYTIETAISTHVLEHIKVPSFNPKNSWHKKLSELSRKAHSLATSGNEEEITDVEEEIDLLVMRLFGLIDEELRGVKETLTIFQSKGVQTAEEAEIKEMVEEAEKIEVPPKRALERLLEKFKEEES